MREKVRKPIAPVKLDKAPPTDDLWTCVVCGSVGLTAIRCPIDGWAKP